LNLDLIISDLRKGKEDEYYEGEIIKHYSYKNNDSDNYNDGVGYCSTGLLMKESGVNMKYWEGVYEISNINDFIDREYEYEETLDIIDEALNKLNYRYGIDFTKKYDNPITCPCELILGDNKRICEEQINTFEHLTFHLNDFHATNYNEVADLIIEVSQKYNLETGEKLN